MSNFLFNSIAIKKPKSNTFDLSHEVKMSGNMGKLMPFFCAPVLPGDKFRMNTEVLLRFAPMLAPIMHRVNVYTHFFFVPNRLVWDKWEDFITGGENGDLEPAFPAFDFQALPNSYSRLPDYLGINSDTNELHGTVSQLPFRAYQLIFNEYYRDQNLQPEIDIKKDVDGTIQIDSGNTDFSEWAELLTLRNRAWEKDYFTSALPWTQRSPTEQLIPIAGDVDLFLTKNAPTPIGAVYTDGSEGFYEFDGNQDLKTNSIYVDGSGRPKTTLYGASQDINGNAPAQFDITGHTKGRIAEGVNVTINDLRRASALQRWFERSARGGARYIEQILSHFGVRSSDARLQRPEFLGGGKTPVVISEVLQTSESENTPQGNMSGHGISAGANHSFTRFFEEHGYIIGIMSVMPKSAYQQGIPRHFFAFDKFDFAWPELAHLGEQEIFNKEIYATGQPQDEETFGYTPRYAEYKYHPSRVAGDFKNTLNFWHLGRIFDGPPALNADFVQCNDTNLSRIFAVDDNGSTDKLWIQIYNDVKAIRRLPKYGTPTL